MEIGRQSGHPTRRHSWAGVIDRLRIEQGDEGQPADYGFRFKDGTEISLNARIGGGFRIEFDGCIVCRYCDREGRRSFAGGYCYDCFKALARCDLCVMSPDRCHYHLGTCREPEWGDGFCMQPHLVYLANTSGTKVGITRRGMEQGRWLDQGAIEALVILEAPTRRAAGLAEVEIARLLPDRTDWRKMLRPDVPEQDLLETARFLKTAGLSLADELRWIGARSVHRFHYPFSDMPDKVESLKLTSGMIEGNLLGMKGQYLLLSCGALNIRQHAGYQVHLTLDDEPFDLQQRKGTQLGLF